MQHKIEAIKFIKEKKTLKFDSKLIPTFLSRSTIVSTNRNQASKG